MYTFFFLKTPLFDHISFLALTPAQMVLKLRFFYLCLCFEHSLHVYIQSFVD